MSVLGNSLRRRLPRWFTWNDIRFQWTVVGLTNMVAAMAVGYLVEYFAPTWWMGGAISTALTAVFAAPFIFSALTVPYPTQEPRIVQKYGDLVCWWRNFSTPAAIGIFEGRPVLERWDLFDFRSIYDAAGRLVATEQETDWSMTDMDWEPGMPKHIEVNMTRYNGAERLPWLARLRSPKLLASAQAEILGKDNVVLGYTNYSKVN